MKSNLYNYRSGKEIIPPDIAMSITKVIDEMHYNLGKYEIKNFKDDLSDKLKVYGWSCKVAISNKSSITITSMRQDVGLCTQTGNMARMYADLMKLQSLYMDGKIKAAIFVVPMKDCANSFGGNVANFERLINELTNVFSKVITVPMLIVGFENMED